MTHLPSSTSSAWSRREFLRAAGLAAAPLILPGRVRGQDAPGRRVTVGMIGIGRQTYNANLPTLLGMPDVQVVAVCDVDAWRMDQGRMLVEKTYADRTTAGVFKGCAMHRDFRELLARTDIDAVMISTPDHWHVPMALAAVRAGKDVSCEKPLTLCLREGRVLADAVKQHGRVFRTDSEFRSSKAAYRLVELVRTGRIGTLRRIITGVPGTDVAKPMPPPMPVPGDLDFDAWLGPAPERPYHVDRVHPARNLTGRPGWMRCRDYAQGLISNWGTHLNDIAQWGNNTDHIGPVEVEATGEFPPESGLWNVLLKFRARFRYANGVTLECRTGRPSVRFEGDDGWLEVEYGKGRIEASKPALLEGNPTASAGLLPRRGDKEDFIRAIQSRGRTMEDAEVGHRTCSLSQIALISIQVGGRKLAWDPARERFDHEPANALLDRPSWRGPWRV